MTTAALRQRAELHLLGRIARELFSARLAREGQTRWCREHVPDFATHVSALQAIGAVTASEATMWLERLEEHLGQPPAMPAPPADGLPEPACRLLDELLDASARGRGSGTMRRDNSPYEHALYALVSCGAISADERACRRLRLLDHPELPGAVAEELRHPPAACSGIELERVLIGPATTLPGDVRILRVEVYADGLRLHWQRPGHGEPAGSPLLMTMRAMRREEERGRWKSDTRPVLEVCDDVGTGYRGFGGSWDELPHDDDGVTEFELAIYAPGVPAAARWLEISHLGGAVRLPLAP